MFRDFYPRGFCKVPRFQDFFGIKFKKDTSFKYRTLPAGLDNDYDNDSSSDSVPYIRRGVFEYSYKLFIFTNINKI